MFQQRHGLDARRPDRRLLRFVALVVVATSLGLPSAAVADHLIPDDAVQPRNMGGGQTLGTVTYTGNPLPKATATCRSTAFSFEFASNAFVLNTVIAGFVGPVTITGSGTSPCESVATGVGFITNLQLSGMNMTTKNTLNCPSLVGGYTRALYELTLILSGNCVVNAYGQGIVNFAASLQFVPMGGTGGIMEPVTSAETSGVFAVAPA